MFQVLHLSIPALAAIFLIPIEKHIHFVYAGLAIIFACVITFMFIYSKRHKD